MNAGPACAVDALEGVEVNGDQSGVVLGQEFIHDADDVCFGGGFGEVFDGPVFVVSNAEAVQEIAQELFVGTDEPDLEQVCREGFVCFATDLFENPGVLFGAGFAFDEHRAEFALLGEGIDRGFVEGLFFLVQKLEEARSRWAGHFSENFVGLKHTKGRRLGGSRIFGRRISRECLSRSKYGALF